MTLNVIKKAASMLDSGWPVRSCEDGRRIRRGTSGDEFGEEVNIGLEGISEHESVDLKESTSTVFTL